MKAVYFQFIRKKRAKRGPQAAGGMRHQLFAPLMVASRAGRQSGTAAFSSSSPPARYHHILSRSTKSCLKSQILSGIKIMCSFPSLAQHLLGQTPHQECRGQWMRSHSDAEHSAGPPRCGAALTR